MNKQKRFLIFRLSSLGDVVLTTFIPALIKKAFPDSIINYVTLIENKSVLEFEPNLNEIFIYDKNFSKSQLKEFKMVLEKDGKYDYMIDLHKTKRSRYFYSTSKEIKKIKKFHFHKLILVIFKINIFPKNFSIIRNYAEILEDLAIDTQDFKTKIYLPKELESKVNSQSKSKFIISIAPGAKHFTKMYPQDKFIEIVKKCKKDLECDIILLGSNQEKEICDYINSNNNNELINYAGEISLIETANVIKHSDVLLCNDSGLMHFGVALGVPVIAIFGSTVKEFGFADYKKDFYLIESNLKCRPCTHIGRKYCPKGHFNCMNEIEIDRISATIEKILKKN